MLTVETENFTLKHWLEVPDRSQDFRNNEVPPDDNFSVKCF